MPFATRREERERFLFETEEKTAAFHMAFHPRLGQGSQLQPLDPSIFRHIFPRWAYPKIAVRQTPFCKDLASEFIALQTSSEAPKFKCRLTFMGATIMFEFHQAVLPIADGRHASLDGHDHNHRRLCRSRRSTLQV